MRLFVAESRHHGRTESGNTERDRKKSHVCPAAVNGAATMAHGPQPPRPVRPRGWTYIRVLSAVRGDGHTCPIGGDRHTCPVRGDGHTCPVGCPWDEHACPIGGCWLWVQGWSHIVSVCAGSGKGRAHRVWRAVCSFGHSLWYIHTVVLVMFAKVKRLKKVWQKTTLMFDLKTS